VLLRGVNDSAETLVALSKKLVEQGVLPYYLHQLDRAAGTHHFEVPVERGLALMEAMRAACPGYLVPRYVREVEGRPSKTLLVR
jgi:L-lysine 2,3-aminomutase